MKRYVGYFVCVLIVMMGIVLSGCVGGGGGGGYYSGGGVGGGGGGGVTAPSGTLDITFGRGGIVTTDTRGLRDGAYALAIQPDGKIVVAGYSDNASSGYDIAVVRYNANGTLDTTFGTNGKVTTDIGTNSMDYADALAIQSDGKIVVAGESYNGTNYDFAIVRYNADGSLDTTFGTNGKVITPVGPGDDRAEDLAIQSDGKIVVAGYSLNAGTGADFAIVRYNANGSLDTTFGTNGKVTTDSGTNSDDRAFALAIQKDGKIVVAGWSDYDFAIVRYWP